MTPIFKNDVFMHQSKADFDEKILFRKITHRLEQEMRKTLIRCKLGNEDSAFHSSP